MFFEIASEDDFAARRAATGSEFEQVVRLAHDGFLVLDDEHRVAAIAQPFHHADELAHVARVKADTRLVEDEEGVDERIAEARGEIDALDFAAAERARGAVEREIAEADFEQIGEPREDAVAELLRRVVIGGKRERCKKIASLGEREAVDFGKR